MLSILFGYVKIIQSMYFVSRCDIWQGSLCSYEPKLNVGSISFIARKHNVRADLLAKGACSQNFIFFDVNSLIPVWLASKANLFILNKYTWNLMLKKKLKKSDKSLFLFEMVFTKQRHLYVIYFFYFNPIWKWLTTFIG